MIRKGFSKRPGLRRSVELLIRNGAKIEATCEAFGATRLFWAAHAVGPHRPNRPKDPVGAAKALIAAGANVRTSNKQGTSALECARQAESKEMYELLLHFSGRQPGAEDHDVAGSD